MVDTRVNYTRDLSHYYYCAAFFFLLLVLVDMTYRVEITIEARVGIVLTLLACDGCDPANNGKVVP